MRTGFPPRCAERRSIGDTASSPMPEVNALLAGCEAMQSYDAELAERATTVVVDDLRTSS